MEIQKAKKGDSKNCSRLPNSLKVIMVDLDSRGEMKRLEPNGELEDV